MTTPRPGSNDDNDRNDLRNDPRLLQEIDALAHERMPSHDLWPTIAERIVAPPRKRTRRRWLQASIAAGVLIAGFLYVSLRSTRAPWQVELLAGSGVLEDRTFTTGEELRVGQWLATNPNSRARLHIPAIGTIVVEPDSRVALIENRFESQRLSLQRGAIEARVSAPPRLFQVETPATTAVDLGCAYRLDVLPTGGTRLSVTHGLVALADELGDVFVTEGHECETDAKGIAGVPVRIHASDELKASLRSIADGVGSIATTRDVTARLLDDDTLTLWYLARSTSGDARQIVIDRLSKISPPPIGVDTNDAATLPLWEATLRERWIKPVPTWKRALRWLRTRWLFS